MKRSSRSTAAFSLVEVTLAIGVAAFCLVAIAGMIPAGLKTQRTSANQTKANAIMSQCAQVLRADVRLPPGQASKACPDPPEPNQPCDWDNLHGHWLSVAVPDTLFFTNDGKQMGYGQGTPTAPSGAVFRAIITYMFPPSATTSIAKITVSWPAAQSDLTKVEGSIDMFVAVNR
jgi:type II secretory pathway pseudopilin PulG